MANKTADAIKLNLRLPKPLHKRLKQQARRNNVSLNTEIVNQLSNPKDPRVAHPSLLGMVHPNAVIGTVDAKAIATEIVNRLHGLNKIGAVVLATDLEGAKTRIVALEDETLHVREPVIVTDLETARTRILALEDEVAHLRGQAESERKAQDLRAVPEREKGEERK